MGRLAGKLSDGGHAPNPRRLGVSRVLLSWSCFRAEPVPQTVGRSRGGDKRGDF